MEVMILVGNPSPASRTRAVAEAVARQVATATGAEVGQTIELADYAGSLFTHPNTDIDELLRRVATSDYVVVASPTYKATYTGLLKAFLDRYGTDGLRGVTAVGVMTGGSKDHALAVDTSLRSLLVELGASVPTRGLFFLAGDAERVEEIVSEWADLEVVPVLSRS